jgi:histidyl-tRNA synthetase
VPIGETAERAALKIAQDLRQAGFAVDLGYKGNVGRRMKRANKVNACAAIILGDDELTAGAAKVKDLDSGTETTSALDSLAAALADYTAARP